MSTWEKFVQRVGDRIGASGKEDIEPTVAVALTGVGRYFPEIDTKHLDLPDEALGYLRRAEITPGELDIDLIGRDLGLPEGQAREFVESVLGTIDETQKGEARTHWKRNLPEGLVERLSSASPAISPPPKHPPQGHTLADGAPGSSSPVSTSDDIQSDAPISDFEPHGDTKLSTTEGTTQERLDRTLAEGEPGSSRPVSEEPK